MSDAKPSFSDWVGVCSEEEEECYSTDYIDAYGCPDMGRRLMLSIGPGDLSTVILLSDSAQWMIPELGVMQESFAHAGFSGPIAGLLSKVSRDVDMMRAGYPHEQQPAFDEFLQRIDQLIHCTDSSAVRSCNLQVRDPAGLSTVVARDEDCAWVVTEFFERSFKENDELGIIPKFYSKIAPENQKSTPEEVAKMVRTAGRVACLSGAGISVESGIPPFRSNNEGDESIWGSFSASKMTVHGFNTNDEHVKYWWEMKHGLLPKVNSAAPNQAHRFFGRLEEENKLGVIITQNIDSLHHKGGVPGGKIIELHGHMRGLICSNKLSSYNPLPYRDGRCQYSLSEEEALANGYFEGEAIPRCPMCSSPLRTETVMFNQPMPEGSFAAAVEALSASDLFFVIGTSLIVEPANALPSVALRLGIPIIMINMDATQYDEYATVLVRGPAGSFLSAVSTALDGPEDIGTPLLEECIVP